MRIIPLAVAFVLLGGCASPRERIKVTRVSIPVAELPTDERRALSVALDWLADLVPWAVTAEGQLKACAELGH